MEHLSSFPGDSFTLEDRTDISGIAVHVSRTVTVEGFTNQLQQRTERPRPRRVEAVGHVVIKKTFDT